MPLHFNFVVLLLLLLPCPSFPIILSPAVTSGIAGVAISTTKTLLKHPLDTITVRLQSSSASSSSSSSSLSPPLPPLPPLQRYLAALTPSPFAGLLPSVLSSIPSSAAFFSIKDTALSHLPPGTPLLQATVLSIGAATPFYWLIRSPFELIKTRAQAGTPLKLPTVKEGYTGLPENIAYAFPADVLKFFAYEALRQTGAGAGVAGSAATMMSQCLTTPLDVVRTRVMVGGGGGEGEDERGYLERLKEIAEKEGVGALGVGMGPRVAKAALSGFVQFVVYDRVVEALGGG